MSIFPGFLKTNRKSLRAQPNTGISCITHHERKEGDREEGESDHLAS